MKYAAIALAVLFGVCLLVTGWFFLTCDVQVDNLGASVVNAADRADEFRRIGEERIYAGEEPLDDITEYVFYTWRIRVNNTTFAPLEMVQAGIAPAPGDVDPNSSSEPIDIRARGDGIIEITCLSRVNTGARRTATVSWYLWGHRHSVELRVE